LPAVSSDSTAFLIDEFRPAWARAIESFLVMNRWLLFLVRMQDVHDKTKCSCSDWVLDMAKRWSIQLQAGPWTSKSRRQDWSVNMQRWGARKVSILGAHEPFSGGSDIL
jgi:hypothetical protein